MTLQELYDKHPEWRQFEMVVYGQDGYEYVGDSGSVYLDEDSASVPLIVFTGN